MRRLALASAILLAVSTAATAQSGPPPRVHSRTLSTVTDGGRQVFRLDGKAGDGVAWWPDTTFTTGTIELDIRGRNVPQGSFVGVAFHGVDETTYEAIYFRPFNFATEDPARRLRAVQYVSHPAHPWQVLREQQPGVFEKPVSPPPNPDGWFHVTIRVDGDTVKVFVDRAATAALEVQRLTTRAGRVGRVVGGEHLTWRFRQHDDHAGRPRGRGRCARCCRRRQPRPASRARMPGRSFRRAAAIRSKAGSSSWTMARPSTSRWARATSRCSRPATCGATATR